jgi:hypothetical protein
MESRVLWQTVRVVRTGFGTRLGHLGRITGIALLDGPMLDGPMLDGPILVQKVQSPRRRSGTIVKRRFGLAEGGFWADLGAVS